MKLRKFFGVVLSAFVLTGCATTVSYKVDRPADLDLNGARSIAIESVIVPSYSRYSSSGDDTRVAQYIEDTLNRRITSGGYFTVYTARDRRANADVYFDAEIIVFEVNDTSRQVRIENPNYVPLKPGEKRVEKRGSNINTTEKYIYETRWQRKLHFVMRYSFVNGINDKTIATKQCEFTKTSSEVTDKSDLSTPLDLLRYDINGFVDDVLYAIQPYQETCSVTLLEDETKNDDLKQADKLADKGQLIDSYKIYKRVYDETGYFVAGYNAALLQLALGNLSQAKSEMEKVYKASGDKRAAEYIDYIDKEIQSAQRLKRQDAARR